MSGGVGAAPDGNPYPGLRPFLETEEHLFFGRERQVDAMVDKLRQTHFLAVVGTSGSGKSSLVNCGLRPGLHRGLLASAGSSWRVVQMRPGTAPIRALALALADKGALYDQVPRGPFSAVELIEASLRMSRLGLLDAFEQAQTGPGVNLLVVADQFEELFRYQAIARGDRESLRRLTEESTAFVNLLLAVTEQSSKSVFVVLTMRSDFLGDCAQFDGLPEAINRGQYLVPRMTRDERRRAIEGPAAVFGAQIAPPLLTRLVNDAGDLPDQLSVLQHALHRTWNRWRADCGGKRAIELPDYVAIGAIAGALDQHSEEIFARLDGEEQRRIAVKVFKALTDRGTDARGVRRPTALSTLCALADAPEPQVRAVVDVFRAPDCSFLMPPAAEKLTADTVIDIAHESLMRVWVRLKEWVSEEARSVGNLRRLAQTATLHGENKSGLLRDPELQMALNWREQERPGAVWAARYGETFEPAMAFLDASAAERAAERRAQQSKQSRRQFAVGLVMVALVVTAYYFYRSQDRISTANKALAESTLQAERSAQLAEANQKRAEEKEREADRQRQLAEQERAKAVASAAAAEKSAAEAIESRRLADRLQLSLAELTARSTPAHAVVTPTPVVPPPPQSSTHTMTADDLAKIMPALPAGKRDEWTRLLNAAMVEYDISTVARQAAFLAQVAQETAQLRYLEEIWVPTAQQQRYEPPSSLATTLGNVDPGDGQRYRGRGLIWITGRANYLRIGKGIGVDLIDKPDLAATPEIAARTAAWFWKSRGLNALADQGNMTEITKRINGGLGGLAERNAIYERAKATLGG